MHCQDDVQGSPQWHLKESAGSWRMVVAAASMPGVELSSSAVRIEPTEEGSQAVVVPVPQQAQPLDPNLARCKYVRKRGELVIEWPTAAAVSEEEVARAKASQDEAAKRLADEKAAKKAVEEEAKANAAEEAAKAKAAEEAAKAKAAEEESAQKAAEEEAAKAKAAEEEAARAKAAEEELAKKAAEQAAKAKAEEEAAKAKASKEEAAKKAEEEAAKAKAEEYEAAKAKAAQEEAAKKAEEDAKVNVDSSSSTPSRSADEWKSLGNESVKVGDHAAALESYSAGLAVDPQHAILLSNRALCLHKLGRLEEALQDAQKCAALRPDFVKGFLRGAMVLRDLGRPVEALELLKRAPLNDEVEKLSAEVRPDAEKAEEKRIAALAGPERKKEEGNALFKKGLFEQALSVYSEALAACEDPSSELALAIRNNRAGCYHQLSNFQAVVEDASAVLEQQPGNVKALIRRMIALEPLEKYEAALDDARAILRACPGHDVANRMQHRLGKLVRDRQREKNGGA